MNINEAFPSKYLKASDLGGAVAKVKIASVVYEQLGTDRKIAMYFVGKEKGMILNKTNAQAIDAVYGPDTENWVGADIEVFAMPVSFEGRMVDGLRIRVPRPTVPKQAPRQSYGEQRGDIPPAHASAVAADLDDDIPFAPEWR